MEKLMLNGTVLKLILTNSVLKLMVLKSKKTIKVMPKKLNGKRRFCGCVDDKHVPTKQKEDGDDLDPLNWRC
jgi:hypothetical protein